MQDPLRTELQKHGDGLLESLRAEKQKYSAGLRTLGSPASETINAVDVVSTLEHRKKNRFLKKSIFSLSGTAVSARHTFKSLLGLDSGAANKLRSQTR